MFVMNQPFSRSKKNILTPNGNPILLQYPSNFKVQPTLNPTEKEIENITNSPQGIVKIKKNIQETLLREMESRRQAIKDMEERNRVYSKTEKGFVFDIGEKLVIGAIGSNLIKQMDEVADIASIEVSKDQSKQVFLLAKAQKILRKFLLEKQREEQRQEQEDSPSPEEEKKKPGMGSPKPFGL